MLENGGRGVWVQTCLDVADVDAVEMVLVLGVVVLLKIVVLEEEQGNEQEEEEEPTRVA